MDFLLNSLERQDLIKVVETLLQKFGSDAVVVVTELTLQMKENQLNPAVDEHRLLEQVHRQGSSKVTAVAAFKAEKKEKNKKDFDMSRLSFNSTPLII